MSEQITFQNLFRYIAPGFSMLVFFISLKEYELGFSLTELWARLVVRSFGEGFIFAALVAVIGISLAGHVVSAIYHALINITGLRFHHSNVFETAVGNRIRLFNYDDKEIQADQLAKQLSLSGSLSLFDSSFYRMRKEEDKPIREDRLESFFHIWHGLGTTITGWIIIALFWLYSQPFVENSSQLDRIEYLIIPSLILLVFIGNWIFLRRLCKSYVESWYFIMMDAKEERDARTP